MTSRVHSKTQKSKSYRDLGDENLKYILSKSHNSTSLSTVPEKAYTMVHVNAPTKVEISDESRKACGRAILR